MQILVTGGCGYIGSALLPQLLEEHQDVVEHVTVLDNFDQGSPRNLMGMGLGDTDRLDFRQGDVCEYADVEDAIDDAETVLHLAAITGTDSTRDRREETFAVNYEGTKNVVRAAGEFGVENVVFASSCNLYGRASTTNLDEATEPEPLNPYAEAKREAELCLREAADEHGFDATALRMSTNYGFSPGIRFNLVVNYFLFRALTERPLTVYGDGSNWRPFIHVRDAAQAYKRAALDPEDWPQTVYNVGANDQNYRIETVAEIIRDEIDHAPDVTYLEDENPGPSYHVNFDRLSETGFEPEYTLREGIRELARRFTQKSNPITANIEQS